jgi:hypothetical protein
LEFAVLETYVDGEYAQGYLREIIEILTAFVTSSEKAIH